MIPVGYMLKKIVPPPQWMRSPNVDRVYSVSNCVSKDFLDYVSLWKHNGWWLFDSPSILFDLAAEKNVNLSDMTLLYYEAFEREYDGEKREWIPITPEPSFPTNVAIPDHRQLLGFDVVTFTVHTSPECSPLSCNSLAGKVPTNRNCLFDDFQSAHEFAQQNWDGEPGPYRILSVSTVGG